jgi:phosphoribosylamine--glycine ligase
VTAGRLRVCVVGGGGREHALADALARTADVVVTPGNPGMAELAAGRFVVSAADPVSVDADLFVIGPEAPLVDGLADRLRAAGRSVLGPGADGARLEGSKAWMKQVLVDAGVPTAAHATFGAEGPGRSDPGRGGPGGGGPGGDSGGGGGTGGGEDAAIAYLRSLPGPWVVKTDGLAAGKGVLVTDDRAAAEADVRAKLSGAAFGAAGRRVVIEEHLDGVELSVMALCDGSRAVALGAARDHKRLGTGDVGPNTGGMGAYSPVPGAGDDVVAAVLRDAVEPTLRTLAGRGVDYRGVLYAGVMLTRAGPKLLEFNVRFGDPETQAVLPRWNGDVAAVLAAAAAGRLDDVAPPAWSDESAVTVVLAAPGYPSAPRTGAVITGLHDAVAVPSVRVYAAGVARSGHELRTAGGRVVAVTGLGADLGAARATAYDGASRIAWDGLIRRDDIGCVGEAAQS